MSLMNGVDVMSKKTGIEGIENYLSDVVIKNQTYFFSCSNIVSASFSAHFNIGS